MKHSKALEEVWKWKEEVFQDIKNMTARERIAYFREGRRRLADRTGVKLSLPSITRRRPR
jgi:hypothetical protein